MNRQPLILLEGYETVFSHILVEIAPKAIGRGEMVAVIIQNPLINTDGSNNTSQIFVGSATNMIYSMLPGQESPWICAEDQKDVYIRLDFPLVNPNGAILTLDVSAGDRGEGYVIGNVLTLDPGTPDGTNATLTVDTVNGAGGILTFTLNTPGTGFSPGQLVVPTGGAPTNPATFVILTVETVTPESADVNLLIYRKRKGGLQ